MHFELAIRSLREACALQHTALNTEKSYAHWVRQYAAFLKVSKTESLATTEQKVEAYLTSLALRGVSVSTQN
jgi:site-specific recombinase XerD